MKRFINNSKIKKFLIAIVLIIILFQFWCPNFVFAKIEGNNYTEDYVSDYYYNWVSVMTEENRELFDKEVIQSLRLRYFKTLDDNSAEYKAKKLFELRKDKTLIVCCWVYDDESIWVDGVWDGEYLEAGYEYDDERNWSKHQQKFVIEYVNVGEWWYENGTKDLFNYNEFKYFIGIQDDERVYPIIEEQLKNFIREEASYYNLNIDDIINGLAKNVFDKYKHRINVKTNGEDKENYNVEEVLINDFNATEISLEIEEVDKQEGNNEADLGGWLLDPLFQLVNFIFDALTSVLGTIMNGEDGLQSIQIKPESVGIDSNLLTKEEVHRVNIEPFKTLTGIKHYVVTYSPEEIFSGKIPLLSIDFISGRTSDGQEIDDDGWNSIRAVISQWYKVLRMIAIIGLLSVLIYTGIKIIISANAKDKAKYKEWIINWFIAVAILFSMHYIMSFVISITNEISQLLNQASQSIIVEKCDNSTAMRDSEVNPNNLFVTNLMGLVRFMIQSDNMVTKIGYEVMYIALLVYTIKFTFVYLKRVLNMAFLTLIAPIVALTYPIDKLNDGNAQGFNMWLKEYIFNALLQPMHLVMYYILVGSAVSIAATNPLYGIVVLMFMTEAEKLLKKIFGFDKANGGTVGGMAGAFAAGAVASNIKNIARLASKGSGGKGGSGGEKNEMLDAPKPTEKDSDMNAFLDSPADDNTDNDRGNSRESGAQNDENPTTEQRMFDADEENGEFDNDPSEREARAREAYGNQQASEKSDEEKREMLRDQGWSEEAINDTLGEPNPTRETTTGSREQTEEASSGSRTQMPETTTRPRMQTPETSSGTRVQTPPPTTSAPIHTVATQKEQSRFAKGAKAMGRGAKAVGKRLLKPAWDTDKSWKYNAKRWGRRIGRAALGAGLGITAAAVQAGISITDGKYNPMEGIATFTAGYAGGGVIAKGVGSLISTYQEGATAGDKKAIMERAKARFADRDDVIAFNKKQYPGEEKARMERERDNYLPKGITDLKDMKSCMKYADSLVGKTDGLNASQIAERRKQADAKAAATLDFKNRLKEQGHLAAVYDKSKREKYIQTMVSKASDADKETTRRKYENAFKSIAQYDAANA